MTRPQHQFPALLSAAVAVVLVRAAPGETASQAAARHLRVDAAEDAPALLRAGQAAGHPLTGTIVVLAGFSEFAFFLANPAELTVRLGIIGAKTENFFKMSFRPFQISFAHKDHGNQRLVVRAS